MKHTKLFLSCFFISVIIVFAYFLPHSPAAYGANLTLSNNNSTFRVTDRLNMNIGEIKWLEASYPANGQGVLQIVDPDMNLNPKAVDKFDTNVWSDSDSGGIKLTMTETGEATGIFQGTVYFTTNFQSSGNRLHVAEGDTVTGEYKDRTLPPPYTPSDQLRLTTTTFIGTISQNEQYRILFKSGTFIPDKLTSLKSNLELIVDGLQSEDTVHFLIQFSRIPDVPEVTKLQSKGIDLLDYLTGNTYIASSKVENLIYLENMNDIRWVGPFVPKYKISSSLNPVELSHIPNWARTRDNHIVLTLQLHRDANLTDIAKQIISFEGHVDGVVPIIPDISADFNLKTINDTINHIAQIDGVQFIDFVDPPLQPLNNLARSSSSVELAKTQFPGLDGSGVKVLVYDDGFVDPLNNDFANRVTDLANLIPSTTEKDHATSVAGTLGGSGVNSVNNKYAGMAPNVTIFSSAFIDPDGMIPPFDTGQGLFQNVTNAMDLYHIDLVSMSLGANLVKQHGCDYFSNYTATSVLIDTLVIGGHHGVPLIFFEAAGNNRGANNSTSSCTDFASIDPPAAAKNSIAVGAINTLGNPMTSYSSFGPTKDGRIKPDIVAPGSHDDDHGLTSNVVLQFATSPYDSSYGSIGVGTSSATPVASGTAALLLQLWNNTHSASPSNPLPSTIKAILIHTATDLGLPGPDYQFGWGEINATDAIKLVNDNGASNILIHEGQINTVHQNDSYTINDPTGNFDIKATLVWDDKLPASLTVRQYLKNDLDLTLVSQNGQKYLPFVLDPINYQAPATRGIDHVNNVEMDKGDATSGTWKVWVNSTSVSLAPQSYSIIITKVPRNLNIDLIPPVISPLPDIVVNTTDPTGTKVTYASPVATDNVGVVGVPTCNKPSGSTFLVGSTIIHCSAIDAAGNVGMANFTITVNLLQLGANAHVTINKKVNKGLFGEDLPPSSFPLLISNSSKKIHVISGMQIDLSPGHYRVSENSTGGFTGTFEGPNCDANGEMDLSSGQNAVCNVTNNHCLIATAAFGSELAPEVQFLRDFRDNHIQTTSVGSDFMKVFNNWYYSFSPYVANYETQNPILRDVIKGSIYPLLGILFVSEKAFFIIGGNYGTISAGLIAISLMGAVYVSPLTLSIKSIRNGKIDLRFIALILLGILLVTIVAILSNVQTMIILTSLLFLLSLMAFTALVTAKIFVRIARKVSRSHI